MMIELDIPKESLLALKVPQDEVGEALRMAAAVKLFEVVDELAVGRAAGLALPDPAALDWVCIQHPVSE